MRLSHKSASFTAKSLTSIALSINKRHKKALKKIKSYKFVANTKEKIKIKGVKSSKTRLSLLKNAPQFLHLPLKKMKEITGTSSLKAKFAPHTKQKLLAFKSGFSCTKRLVKHAKNEPKHAPKSTKNTILKASKPVNFTNSLAKGALSFSKLINDFFKLALG